MITNIKIFHCLLLTFILFKIPQNLSSINTNTELNFLNQAQSEEFSTLIEKLYSNNNNEYIPALMRWNDYFPAFYQDEKYPYFWDLMCNTESTNYTNLTRYNFFYFLIKNGMYEPSTEQWESLFTILNINNLDTSISKSKNLGIWDSLFKLATENLQQPDFFLTNETLTLLAAIQLLEIIPYKFSSTIAHNIEKFLIEASSLPFLTKDINNTAIDGLNIHLKKCINLNIPLAYKTSDWETILEFFITKKIALAKILSLIKTFVENNQHIEIAKKIENNELITILIKKDINSPKMRCLIS